MTGPGGNTAYRGGVVGPNGGAAAGAESRAPAGAVRREVQRSDLGGRVAAGARSADPRAGGGAGCCRRTWRGGGWFRRVSPSGRYTAAAAVRSNYRGWGAYGRGWYGAHPGGLAGKALGCGAAWTAATWTSDGAWMDYYPLRPFTTTTATTSRTKTTVST